MAETAGTPPATPTATPTDAPASSSPPAAPSAAAPAAAATAAPAKDPGARKGIPKFDKLWESMGRFWRRDGGDAVAPSGAVTRTRHRAPRVLFICTGNAARSPMAEAFATHEGLYAESAGTFPAKEIPRECVDAMSEKGFDLSGVRPKLLDPTRLGAFDRVITFGTSLPPQYKEGARIEDWPDIWDPAGLPLEGYRLVAAELERRIGRLAKHLKGKQAAQTAPATKPAKRVA